MLSYRIICRFRYDHDRAAPDLSTRYTLQQEGDEKVIFARLRSKMIIVFAPLPSQLSRRAFASIIVVM